jgi:hypothetical protein
MITEQLIQWIVVFGGLSAFFLGLCIIADFMDKVQRRRKKCQKMI